MASILIVDEHAPIVRVLRIGLETAGHEVQSANNGSECLVKLCDGLPDFLITDIDMPRMNGRELCMAIQQQFPDRQFPIIVLTSRSEVEHREWTRRIPNLGFMEKPVSIRRLVATIQRKLTLPAQQTGT